MAVGKGNVGLDVIDGRAIAQVSAPNMDDGAALGKLNALQLHAGKANGVGPKRAARGEYAHPLAATQTRRTHRGRPVGSSARVVVRRGIGRNVTCRAARRPVLKAPEQPKMRELVQAAHRVCTGKLGLKDDAPLQVRGQKAVPGNTELLRQVGTNVCDRFHARHCIAAALAALSAEGPPVITTWQA